MNSFLRRHTDLTNGGVESNLVYYWFFPGRESARKGRVGCQESVEWHGRGGVVGGAGGVRGAELSSSTVSLIDEKVGHICILTTRLVCVSEGR